MADKPKGKRKREPFYPMMPDTHENIARAVTRPPEDGWAYERERKAKRGDA